MDKLQRMDYWYSRSPGNLLFNMEYGRIEGLLARMPGDTLLQLGGPSDLSLVASSEIRKKIYYSLDGATSPGVVSICGELERLPLQEDCLDVAVLAHVLSCTDNPAAVLCQLYHSVVPGGKVLILGFNPYSLWGIKKRLSHQRSFPWAGQFHSLWKIKRALHAAHFQIVYADTFCFKYPFQSTIKWHNTSIMEMLGRLFLPACGGVYLVLAEKEQEGMMPLVDKWSIKRNRTTVGGLASPTAQRHFSAGQYEKD